jgi:uncharacterized protein (DUF433 family)
MNSQDRITADLTARRGKGCIRGARVIVSVASDSLTSLESPDEIACAYGITHDVVDPVRHYGAERCGRSCEEHQNE